MAWPVPVGGKDYSCLEDPLSVCKQELCSSSLPNGHRGDLVFRHFYLPQLSCLQNFQKLEQWGPAPPFCCCSIMFFPDTPPTPSQTRGPNFSHFHFYLSVPSRLLTLTLCILPYLACCNLKCKFILGSLQFFPFFSSCKLFRSSMCLYRNDISCQFPYDLPGESLLNPIKSLILEDLVWETEGIALSSCNINFL